MKDFVEIVVKRSNNCAIVVAKRRKFLAGKDNFLVLKFVMNN